MTFPGEVWSNVYLPIQNTNRTRKWFHPGLAKWTSEFIGVSFRSMDISELRESPAHHEWEFRKNAYLELPVLVEEYLACWSLLFLLFLLLLLFHVHKTLLSQLIIYLTSNKRELYFKFSTFLNSWSLSLSTLSTLGSAQWPEPAHTTKPWHHMDCEDWRTGDFINYLIQV